MIKTKQIEGLHKVLSCGGLDVPTISVGLTGLLNVGTGTFIINPSADFTADYLQVTVAPLVNHQLVANQYSYVVVDWNGGSPQYQVITNNTTINHSNILAVYNVIWENHGAINEGHYFHVGKYGYGLVNKLSHRVIHTERFARESGFSLGETGTRNITISAGIIWYDGEEISLGAIDTSITHYHLYYHSAPGVWTAVTRNQYSNTEYDDNSGGLLILSNNNRYAVSWVYRGVTANDVYVILGSGDYTQDQALLSQPSLIPDIVAKQAFLVGRIIVQKNLNTAYRINSIFDIPFTSAGGVSDHAQLSNLQGGQPNEYYHLTAQERLDLLNEIALTEAVNNPTGFENRVDSTLSYDPLTQAWAITGTYNVWIDGQRFAKTGEAATITPVYGATFIKYDSAGVFNISASPWDIDVDCPISYVFFNDDLSDSFMTEERHGIIMDSDTKGYLHHTAGSVYKSGFAVADYTLNSDVVNENKYSVTSGEFYDGDLLHTVAGLADNGPYNIFYRTGASGNWTWSKTEAYPYFINTNSIRYNQFTGGTWQLTNITTNNRWVNYYVFATNAKTTGFQIIIIPGQTIYTTLANAQTETVANLSLGNLPFDEIVAVARVTHQFNTGFSNANGRARIVAVSKLLGTAVNITQAASNHNSMSGIQGGTTNEAFHLTEAQHTRLTADDHESITLQLRGFGDVVPTGFMGYKPIDFNCEVVSWTFVGDLAGSCVVDIWKNSVTIPTVADTIVGGNPPTYSTVKSTGTPTGWSTVTLNAGDVLGFNVNSAATVTEATLSLKVKRL